MRRVLMIHTGGTLGMQPRDPDHALAPNSTHVTITEQVPELLDIAEIESAKLFDVDSTDMTPTHWLAVARKIVERYDEFDGFVVTHGTDAMVYTGCALSFMLRNLAKPVILTGSQRPLADPRSDGRINLVGATDLATRDIPEVGIYFDGVLYRANRAKKTSSFDYHAYSSPNFPHVAELGAGYRRLVRAETPSAPLSFEGAFDERVASVNLVPQGQPFSLDALIGQGLRGVVIEAFGVGNIPCEPPVGDAIVKLVESGVVVVITSQCAHGAIDLSLYAGGRRAFDSGAIGSGDMTYEAATVKLMYLLGTLQDADAVRAAFGRSLAGEINVDA